MHLHYITLKRQSYAIQQYLKNAIIQQSFTQAKNEWILELRTPAEEIIYWQLSTDPHYAYCILNRAQQRRRQSMDVFPELLGSIIQDIAIIDGERLIGVHFVKKPWHLLLQFFPLNVNFFLLDSKQTIIKAFKQNKRWEGQHYTVPQPLLADPFFLDPSQWQALLEQYSQDTLSNFLKKRLRYFTRPVIAELLHRSGLTPETPLNNLNADLRGKLWHHIQQLFSQFETAKPIIYYQHQLPQHFTLGEFESLAHLSPKVFDDLNVALRTFCFSSIKWQHIVQKQQMFQRRLNDRLQFITRTIAKMQLDHPGERAAHYRKIGQLILAQPGVIKPGQSSAQLVDFFSPEQPRISIRIPEGKKPPEIAAMYFQKAKDTEQNMMKRKQRLQGLKKEQEFIQHILSQLENATTEKALQKIEQQLKSHRIIGTSGEEATALRLPYREFHFKGYPIWVGKSARDNDALTFKFAHKEDWWLHVQGYRGAHVIIRNLNRQEHLSPAVKEYAARLAVTFSEARHARYVPVFITRVKYVRKPRKAPPGAVIPQRTETVFVDPLPENSL